MKRNNQLSKIIHKLFQNDRFVAIFSLSVALIVWLVISISENPQRTITVTGVPLTVDVQGTLVETLGMEVVSKDHPETVNVVVSGPSYIVSSLKGSDMSVSASLAKVTKSGRFTLELNANRNSSKTGYEILSVSPGTVDVTFDFVDTKTFNIIPSALGVSASEGLVAEKPTFVDASKSSITISGSREVLSKISRVEAVARANETLSETTIFDATLKFYDVDGEEVDVSILDVPFDTVEITVPIFKEKLLSVKFGENLSTAFKNIPKSFSSNKVLVRGEPHEIDELESVTLSDIDISQIPKESIGKSAFAYTPEFLLPSTVKVVGADEFKVTLNLSTYTTKEISVKTVIYKGLSEGLKASVSGTNNITVCVLWNDAYKVKPETFETVIDCTNKEKGIHTAYFSVDSAKYPNLWILGKAETTLEIK